MDLTGTKDAWAFVRAHFEDADVSVLTRVRIGTCRKGPWGNMLVGLVQVWDKHFGRHRAGHQAIEVIKVDVLDTTLTEIRRN